jgi:hypothetical protein
MLPRAGTLSVRSETVHGATRDRPVPSPFVQIFLFRFRNKLRRSLPCSDFRGTFVKPNPTPKSKGKPGRCSDSEFQNSLKWGCIPRLFFYRQKRRCRPIRMRGIALRNIWENVRKSQATSPHFLRRPASRCLIYRVRHVLNRSSRDDPTITAPSKVRQPTALLSG